MLELLCWEGFTLPPSPFPLTPGQPMLKKHNKIHCFKWKTAYFPNAEGGVPRSAATAVCKNSMFWLAPPASKGFARPPLQVAQDCGRTHLPLNPDGCFTRLKRPGYEPCALNAGWTAQGTNPMLCSAQGMNPLLQMQLGTPRVRTLCRKCRMERPGYEPCAPNGSYRTKSPAIPKHAQNSYFHIISFEHFPGQS